MRLKTFDRLAAAGIVMSVIFSGIVAITTWDWFPYPGDWAHIAHIPNMVLNHAALLLPPVIILLYLLIRRLYFKKHF